MTLTRHPALWASAGAACMFAALWWATPPPPLDGLAVVAAMAVALACARLAMGAFDGQARALLTASAGLLTPLALCTLKAPALVLAGVIAVGCVDGILRKDTLAAAREGIALSAGGLVAVWSGLPDPGPDTAQALGLFAAMALISVIRTTEGKPAKLVRDAFSPDRLAEAGCLASSTVLVLHALETGRVQWALLAFLPLLAIYLDVGEVLVNNGALALARQLLALPNLSSAGALTAEGLATFCERLRLILKADELWFHTRLPAGPVWVHVSARSGRRLLDRAPAAQFSGGRPDPSGRPHLIARPSLPGGWRAGVRIALCSPDGRDAGHLVLGWIRRGGAYRAGRITNGMLSEALSSMARALGGLWAHAHGTHDLEEERSRLTAVVEHSNVAIVALGDDRRITVWNAAMARLTGVPAGDALARPDAELFQLYDDDGVPVQLSHGLAGSMRLVTPAGRSHWVQVSSSTPAPSGLITAVFVDESAQRQLDQVQRLLLSSVHHELHGPLTAIRGHAQLLEPALPAEAPDAESVEAIQDAAEMMQTILGDLSLLLDAQGPAGPRLSATPLELGAVLRKTLRSAPGIASRARLHTPVEVTVSADPVRLRQCLLVVLGNAGKYAPEGQITLAVGQSEWYGVIMVADEGPGIPAEERDLVVQPYYRSQAVKHLPGSGMGLHVAATLINSMGGGIELAQAPSGGLEVQLWLPLADPPAPAGSATERERARAGTSP